jgi:ribosome maturation factor RimP
LFDDDFMESGLSKVRFLFMIGRFFMAKGKNHQPGGAAAVVEALVRPTVEGFGLRLWDVRFEKEGASWYLRLFIDKEGGVTIDDCENLSRRMDKILDEADPISQSYYFEVSSPGIGRDLVRPWHFERYLGEQIEVKLIRPMQLENGSSLREFVAPLCSCDDQTITVELDGQQLTIEKKDAAYIRLYEQISFK